MSFIGLDIGTTGCKAIVFDERWEILAKASREYPILTPRPGWAEQDAKLVWELALQSLSEATAHSGSKPAAMALSVQGEAVMPVDRDGDPLRHAMLGMDTRTTAESDWLAAKFSAEELYRRTGMPIHTMNTLNKLLWLRKNEPDVWKSTHQFVLYEDFFIRRLTGNASISHCLASRTQMYDLHAKTWAVDILDKCEIDGRRVAALAPEQGGVVGAVGRPLADRLGLEAGLLIASGGHDQACAALGSGVTQSGLAMVSTGTAEVVEVAMVSPVLSESLRRANISIYRHVVPGLYLAMTLNHSGGLLLRWFRDTLCRDRCAAAAESGKDAYDLILAEAPRGPTNLMVLPHFAGSGTPLLDTTSRGAILGMSFATTQAEIAKAILEGLTFELRLNLELLKQSGVEVAGLHAVGGGARSELWLQLKADICRTELRIPRVTEAACLGAAMVASVAAGACPDLQAAATGAVCFDRTVVPDDEMATKYDGRFELYRRLYPQLIHLLRQC